MLGMTTFGIIWLLISIVAIAAGKKYAVMAIFVSATFQATSFANFSDKGISLFLVTELLVLFRSKITNNKLVKITNTSINNMTLLCIIERMQQKITPPFHQASLPTTASFLCAYRDTEHGCKSHAQIRRLHVPVALQ